MTRHAKYNEKFPRGSEAREMKVNAYKSNLRGLQRKLKKFCISPKTATEASFKASFFLGKERESIFGWRIAKGMFSRNI